MSINYDTIFKKYKQGRREDLIPLLQDIQDVSGYLSEETIIRAGAFTGLSTTRIYGLATFYDQFRFIPAGRIHIRVCNGTSCFLNGSQAVMNKIKEITGLNPGETARDGIFSYEIETCMGGCNHAPLVRINNKYYSHIKPDHLPELIKKLRFIIEND